MGKATTRLAIAATASIAALGMSTASASAAWDPGDWGVLDTGTPFRLLTNTLEPGCWLANQTGSPVASHVDVTQFSTEAHVTVLAYDVSGKLVENLQWKDPGAYSPVASVIEHDGSLYLGSFALSRPF